MRASVRVLVILRACVHVVSCSVRHKPYPTAHVCMHALTDPHADYMAYLGEAEQREQKYDEMLRSEQGGLMLELVSGTLAWR